MKVKAICDLVHGEMVYFLTGDILEVIKQPHSKLLLDHYSFKRNVPGRVDWVWNMPEIHMREYFINFTEFDKSKFKLL